MAGRSLCLRSGMPSSIADSSKSMLLSDEVAVWTCSQLTMCVELIDEMSDSSSWLSVRVGCS